MICNECKRAIKDDAKFCPWCGSKVLIQAEENAPNNETVTTTATAKTVVQTPTYEEPISVKEWLIMSLIMIIPIVNIVMIFVWAFGSKEKKSKANYFKALLIISGIAFAFIIVLLLMAFSI